MSTLTLRRTAAVAAVVALAASMAVAQPADAEDVDVTVSVTADGASALFVTHATDPVTLGSTAFDTNLPSTVTGILPTTTVTDERGQLLAPWTVQVSGLDLVHTTDGSHSIGASNARVYMDAADLTGVTNNLIGALSGMTVTGAEYNVDTGNDLSTPYTLIEGTTELGNGSLDYTPTMDVEVPASTPAGDYTGTVTQTVS